MKQFPVLVILLTASLGACNPKPTADHQQATPAPASPTPRPPDPNDPPEIQRRFVKVINEAIKKAESTLQKPVTREVNGGMHNFFIEYTGKLEYDIKTKKASGLSKILFGKLTVKPFSRRIFSAFSIALREARLE